MSSGLSRGLEPPHTTANVALMLGDLKMDQENKIKKKIPNSKNLAFYLGNQKFDNYVALKNQLTINSEYTAVGMQKYLPT